MTDETYDYEYDDGVRTGVDRALFGARIVAMVVFALAAVLLATVVVGPRFLPYKALVVRSGSMAPTMPTGSVAFYHRQDASTIRVGEVILFSEPSDPSVFVSHRVHQIVSSSAGSYFITEGDANPVPDTWRIPVHGTGWVVAFHVPYVGYVLSALSSGWARLMLLVVPALILGLLTLADVWSPRRRSDELLT
jgi:signal peptidase I